MFKRILLVALTVISVAVTFWVYSRWNVWFGRNPEPVFSISESITCVQLSVGDDPLTDRCVSWRSRPDSLLLDSGAVQLIWINGEDTLRPHINRRKMTSVGGSANYYWTHIHDLKPGIHHYAIITPDTVSDLYTTYVTADSTVSVMVIGDVQDKHYSGTDTLLRRAVDSLNPDFLFQLGDLIERPQQRYWNRYFSDFDSVCTSLPMAVVVGNHDYHKGINKYPDERLFLTFPYYLNQDTVAPVIGCHMLDFGATRFYMLDTNQPVWRLFTQRLWLKNCLSDSQGVRERVVLMHHPLRSAESRFNNLIVRFVFEPIIRKGNVSLVLAGHEHTYHVLDPDETGGYKQIISHFSAKNYVDADGESGRRPLLLRFPVR